IGIIYSFFIEPNAIAINTVPIIDEELASLLHDEKVVQISDLHISSVGYREKKLIKMLDRIKPDILFITGDFLTNSRDEDSCLEVLRKIDKPTHGIWAVLGNADRFKRDGSLFEDAHTLVKKIENLGITILEDKSKPLVLNGKGGHLFIVGVEGSSLSWSKLDYLLQDVPENSPIILLSHYPDILEKRTDVLTVNLGEEESKGLSGWGWQDNAFFEYDTGMVRFEKDGFHTIRVQSRERGVSIDQICLVEETGGESLVDFSRINRSKNGGGMHAAINPYGREMIVIKAENIPDSCVFGCWKKARDPAACSNPVLKDTSGFGKSEKPLLEPEDYFEADFYARGRTPYHLWVRMKAENDSPTHDSIYIQFSDAVNKHGYPVYRIGEWGVRSNLKKINLILAGHTHGGQIRMPFLGALEILPHHSVDYDKGLFESQGTKMYVNRGIGMALIPMRFLCPPEITVFQFKRDKESL
ncbi:MAG: metallophosphoesterase, partial [Candidatus Aminicenantes bacterium]